jgi:hypothetical protein
MLTARRSPFKTIIGGDVSEKINITCEKNIQIIKPRLKCKSFVNVTSNAADYQITDEATIIYFFNPFGIEEMNNVFHSISKFVSVNPRRVY